MPAYQPTIDFPRLIADDLPIEDGQDLADAQRDRKLLSVVRLRPVPNRVRCSWAQRQRPTIANVAKRHDAARRVAVRALCRGHVQVRACRVDHALDRTLSVDEHVHKR